MNFGRRSRRVVWGMPFLLFAVISGGVLQAQPQLAPAERLLFYTEEWEGERDLFGRPLVSDRLLERVKHVGVEEAWSTLRRFGYHNQLESRWEILNPGEIMVGRALTVSFLPRRPDLDDRLTAIGRESGLGGGTNQWPIGLLEPGDVIVVDHYGKSREGAFIGNNLAQAIYSRSGNGAIIYGQARDITGVREVEGFNVWVKAWHPTSSAERMLISINEIIRIGEAVVLPGDVVLASEAGVVFIPPHLTEKVIVASEILRLTDSFRIERMQEGVYTSQEVYSQEWTPAIRSDFFQWLEDNRSRLIRQVHADPALIGTILERQSMEWETW